MSLLVVVIGPGARAIALGTLDSIDIGGETNGIATTTARRA